MKWAAVDFRQTSIGSAFQITDKTIEINCAVKNVSFSKVGQARAHSLLIA
jgi:hypothetical protein